MDLLFASRSPRNSVEVDLYINLVTASVGSVMLMSIVLLRNDLRVKYVQRGMTKTPTNDEATRDSLFDRKHPQMEPA
uniref:Neur_chan_memb domain-containing protein n=1 Tax=Panagrellus redivivus TaxID=6233 RepID=A0A7E4VUH7_PANRE